MKNPRGASSVFNGLQVFFNPDTKLEKGKALRTTYAQIPANSLGIGSLATFVSHTHAGGYLLPLVGSLLSWLVSLKREASPAC